MAELRFGFDGVLRETAEQPLDEAQLQAIGRQLGGWGRVGLGGSATERGQRLVEAAGTGVLSAGAVGEIHPLPCAIQGAWAARKLGWPVSLFVEAEAHQPAYLRIFDPLGLMPTELPPHSPPHRSSLTYIPLSEEGWAEAVAGSSALRRGLHRRVRVAVGRDSPVNRAIGQVLRAMGCQVEPVWRPGIPAFFGSHGGFVLSAQDETGNLVTPGQLLALLTLIEMENGGGRVAVPEQASAMVELVAAGYRGTVLRLGLDGEEARRLYASLPWLWSAPGGAARICARMGSSGQSLATLLTKIPRFGTSRREIPLYSDRDRILEALAREQSRSVRGRGIRVRGRDGWVYLLPLAHRAALKVVAEGPDLELAAELCDFYAGRAAALDRELEGGTDIFSHSET